MGSVYIPYGKDGSENFKRMRNRYNIRKLFDTKQTLRRSLMKTRPERDPQQMQQCAYRILYDCGETGRPLAVLLREHTDNFKEGLLEKSKLAQPNIPTKRVIE
jgi:hypothetical protein